ncbi:MAG: hypothetical protein PUB75_01690 [Firmicutes bacterium]|nr:hypothetical protein [Bacillota bacterium]
MKLRTGRKEKNNIRPKSGQTIIRVEDLQELIEKNGGEIDEDTLVSMYVPRRNIRRMARDALRLDKVHMLVYGLIALVMILFIFAFMQEKMGNFTINLDRLEMFRKGVSISETGEFENPTAKLKAASVENATNISINDLPKDIDSVQGDHNGRDYMAYTYFVRNAGKEDLGYEATITLDKSAKGAEEAVRVAVWHNGERVVYAAPSKNGKPEKGCVNFKSDEVVCRIREPDFLLGNVDKYTVAIWLEGDDPECVDKIIGGALEFSMRIDAIEENKTGLLSKLIQDIRDTLTGDDAIGAAGNDAPDYYKNRNVTWETRRNQ